MGKEIKFSFTLIKRGFSPPFKIYYNFEGENPK